MGVMWSMTSPRSGELGRWGERRNVQVRKAVDCPCRLAAACARDSCLPLRGEERRMAHDVRGRRTVRCYPSFDPLFHQGSDFPRRAGDARPYQIRTADLGHQRVTTATAVARVPPTLATSSLRLSLQRPGKHAEARNLSSPNFYSRSTEGLSTPLLQGKGAVGQLAPQPDAATDISPHREIACAGQDWPAGSPHRQAGKLDKSLSLRNKIPFRRPGKRKAPPTLMCFKHRVSLLPGCYWGKVPSRP